MPPETAAILQGAVEYGRRLLRPCVFVMPRSCIALNTVMITTPGIESMAAYMSLRMARGMYAQQQYGIAYALMSSVCAVPYRYADNT